MTKQEINDFISKQSIYCKQEQLLFDKYLKFNRGAVEFIENENNSLKTREEVLKKLMRDYIQGNYRVKSHLV